VFADKKLEMMMAALAFVFVERHGTSIIREPRFLTVLILLCA
jgi:hypothetical protein